MSKLFVSLSAPFAVREAWSGVAQRLGVEVTHAVGDATHGMPWHHDSAEVLAAQPHLHFMSPATLAIITDRIAIGQHLPALQAVAADSRATLEAALGSGPVYLKPRTNAFKRYPGTSALTHSSWPSPAAVPEAAYAEMVAGRLVACPDLGSPHTNLEIDFAVAPDGLLRVVHCFNHGFQGGTFPLRMTLGGTAPSTLMLAMQEFCLAQGIRGGFFNIQAVQHAGQWVIMDWNPRPSGMYPGFAQLHPGIADHGLAHMLGIERAAVPVYIELRPYWDRQIENAQASVIRALGLHPRWVYDRSRIARVAGVADTVAEVTTLFNTFEATL